MKYVILSVLSACLFFAFRSIETDDGLVAHWPMDRNASDVSPYFAEGYIIGDAKLVDDAIDGRAIDLDGDDYIEVGAGGQAPPHLKDLAVGSISLWFKARSWDIQTTVLPIFYYGKADPCVDTLDASNGGLVIEVGHGGIFPSENVFFTIYDEPCSQPTVCFDSNDDAGIIKPGQWYHFVAVVGEDYNTGYLNGQELIDRRYHFSSDSSSIFFSGLPAHEKLWFGKGYWRGKDVFFDGLFDDVRIYNRPLSSEETNALYQIKQ